MSKDEEHDKNVIPNKVKVNLYDKNYVDISMKPLLQGKYPCEREVCRTPGVITPLKPTHNISRLGSLNKKESNKTTATTKRGKYVAKAIQPKTLITLKHKYLVLLL